MVLPGAFPSCDGGRPCKIFPHWRNCVCVCVCIIHTHSYIHTQNMEEYSYKHKSHMKGSTPFVLLWDLQRLYWLEGLQIPSCKTHPKRNCEVVHFLGQAVPAALMAPPSQKRLLLIPVSLSPPSYRIPSRASVEGGTETIRYWQLQLLRQLSKKVYNGTHTVSY